MVEVVEAASTGGNSAGSRSICFIVVATRIVGRTAEESERVRKEKLGFQNATLLALVAGSCQKNGLKVIRIVVVSRLQAPVFLKSSPAFKFNDES